jgi:anti-sigma regulatory factor (Ser/Thr protein kinase)
MQALLTARLDGGVDAPTRARSELRRLHGRLGDAYEDVELLVSELVTNAVRHADADLIEMSVVGADSTLRVEVTAPGPPLEKDVVQQARAAQGGYGFALVERLAERWGVSNDDDGTRVWFEMALRRAIAPP